MSDSVAFPLISGICFAGLFLAYYLANIAREKGFQIVTGVGHGVPIPKSYREVMLYTIFVVWGCGSAGISLFVVFVSLLIAPNVVSEDAELAAYFVAYMHSVVVFTWATMGPLLVIYHRRIVRQAEAG